MYLSARESKVVAVSHMKSPSRDNKLTGVRLSVTAQEILNGGVRDHYGLKSNTAIIETLIREKARALEIERTRPRVFAVPIDGDEDELAGEAFDRQRANIDRHHNESTST